MIESKVAEEASLNHVSEDILGGIHHSLRKATRKKVQGENELMS